MPLLPDHPTTELIVVAILPGAPVSVMGAPRQLTKPCCHGKAARGLPLLLPCLVAQILAHSQIVFNQYEWGSCLSLLDAGKDLYRDRQLTFLNVPCRGLCKKLLGTST